MKARNAAERRHTDKQNLVNMARLVQKLEEHRTELVEGELCALCSATEHPYAEAEALPRAEQLTAELDAAARELQCTVAELRRTEGELTKPGRIVIPRHGGRTSHADADVRIRSS